MQLPTCKLVSPEGGEFIVNESDREKFLAEGWSDPAQPAPVAPVAPEPKPTPTSRAKESAAKPDKVE